MANILVVDDSPIDRHLIKSVLLRRNDWSVIFAENGQQALDQLRQAAQLPATRAISSTNLGLPDAIITDLQMPELDGLSLVRHVRQYHYQIPVVLVTSQGSEQIACEALRFGATSFCPKGALETELPATVEQVLHLANCMKFERNPLVCPETRSVAFVLENDQKFVGPAIEYLQDSLPRWSDRDRLQIGMALAEAITNAMQHGNLEVDSELRDSDEEDAFVRLIDERRLVPPFCHRRVRIEAEFSEKHLCVQITDDGPGFDPTKVLDPTHDENVNRVSGRGLFLINAFMDTVSYNRQGNQITMIKIRRTDEG